MSSKSARRGQRFAWVLCSVALVLVSTMAFARGRLEWKTKTIKEADNKSWRVELAVHLPKAPDVPTLPMRFEFQPTVYYERTMLDGDKLVERKVPLENRQSLIESVDVGFLDPGSGKIEKRTRFVFKVTRAHGYEAGEYQVTIRDGRTGDMIGAPTRLIFQGENEIVDRRAMVFTGEKKKKRDPEATAATEDSRAAGTDMTQSASSAEENAEPTESAAEATAESTARAEAAGSAAEAPPEIKEKPGGCGCRVRGAAASSSSTLALITLGLLAIGLRRVTC